MLFRSKGPLGWFVLHVDKVTRIPGKTLDQARPAIVAEISAEKRRAALTDLSAKAEEQFENGVSLADVAKSLNLTVATTEPLTSDGSVFGKPGAKAPTPVLALVQAGVLEIHTRGSTVDHREEADRLVLDLDPGPGVSWRDVVAAAREVRGLLTRLKLKSFVKTTGGKGLHVVVPLAKDRKPLDWDAAKTFAKEI